MTEIHAMREADFPSVWSLVKDSKVLDIHTPYTYWVQLHARPALMYVAEHEGEIVGFISGLAHIRREGEVFVWQIGVCEEFRHQGIGTALMDAMYRKAKEAGFSSMSLTVTEDNLPSKAMFEKFALSLGSQLIEAGSTGTMGNNMKNEIIFEMAI